MKTRFLKYGLVFFLFMQIVFYQILRQIPDVVERFYSKLWFEKFGIFMRRVFGEIPFSVGDCFYFLLLFFVGKWIVKNRKNWQIEWKKRLLVILNFCSIFYFMFHFCWGFNYYRIPLSEKMELNTDFTEADLVDFTKKLIEKTNEVQFQISKNKSLKVVVPYSAEKLLLLGENGYQNLAKKHSFFEYRNVAVKRSLLSKPLSYMGFGGYLNPFSIEAQVNMCIPKYAVSMTVSHEMAHQIGFANESECNFIGYLAATKNDDLYAQYSGYSFALHYCLMVLKREQRAAFKELYAKVNSGILKNFEESKEFWKAHESFVETGFKFFYDHFLKANNQKDGLYSYGKFLNLLINYEKQSAVRTVETVE